MLLGEGRQEPAYVHIRLKTPKEKKDSKYFDDNSTIECNVVLFLQIECVFSKFDSDYISFQELKHRYTRFCKLMGVH